MKFTKTTSLVASHTFVDILQKKRDIAIFVSRHFYAFLCIFGFNPPVRAMAAMSRHNENRNGFERMYTLMPFSSNLVAYSPDPGTSHELLVGGGPAVYSLKYTYCIAGSVFCSMVHLA